MASSSPRRPARPLTRSRRVGRSSSRACRCCSSRPSHRTRSRTAPWCCRRGPSSASWSPPTSRTRSSPSTVRRRCRSSRATRSKSGRAGLRCRSCGPATARTTTCSAPSSAGVRARGDAVMLRTLRVRDLAIIDELEVVLEPGLNVITGETGAGKSILLQALDVALGGRPDADLVRSGADEGAVEALFTVVPATVRELLAAAGIPDQGQGGELIVRRVIAQGGRTRAYVNGALGSLPLLHELAPHLLRVYGQDEHQALRRVESHRELLDAIGGLGSTLEEMRLRHARLAAAREELAHAEAERDAAAERSELLAAQLQELERSALMAGEEEALGAERVRLVHAERLAALTTAAEAAAYSDEGAGSESLGRALGSLREAERLDPALAPVRMLLETALAEVEEAGQALGHYARGLTLDAERLDAVEERLALLARMRRKYGGTVEDLIARRQALSAELAGAGSEERLASLRAT